MNKELSHIFAMTITKQEKSNKAPLAQSQFCVVLGHFSYKLWFPVVIRSPLQAQKPKDLASYLLLGRCKYLQLETNQES